MNPVSRRVAILLFLLPACLPPFEPGGSGTAATTPATQTSDPGPTGTTETTGVAPTTTGLSSETGSTGTSASGTQTGADFIAPHDHPREDWCDPWQQDCPLGQKCTAEDGFDDTHCVDIVPDPRGLGETCTYSDYLLSGHDDCALGLLCWQVDPGTGVGTCHALCSGSPDSMYCDDPATQCWPICQSCIFGICVGGCDPLALDCPGGNKCLPEGYLEFGEFICVPDLSGEEGQYADPCSTAADCDPGLFCASVAAVPGCPPGLGCCSPFCDLGAPACPDADLGVTCNPWYRPLPGLEHLGVCGLPE